jgi:signal transduction histidine kinase
MVKDAVGQIEKLGEAAFPLFRDRTGPFRAKDAYVFVIAPNGVDLVNPAFPNLEGRNLLDVRDTQGKALIRDMLEVVRTRGSGWVDYMWPKPGESVSTQKSTYVSRANVADGWLLVGAGVYLADAPKAALASRRMAAPELMALVREGAAVLERRGQDAYPEFRTKGSKWFLDDTYFIVWALDGTRVFHAADPSIEGKDASGAKDVLGRPYGKMFLEVAAGPSGEGWIHYMYPEPGDIFPTWKSTFVKRVGFPSGKQHLIGAGIYNMQMDEAFIEDLVDRAAALVAERGKQAFDSLRDETGSFVFMDTYVFVDAPDGTELVNAAQPSLEGMNVSDLRDAKGKTLARDYIAAALKEGSAWVEYHWYRPGQDTPSPKRAYVRRVRSGADTYVVGSGLYVEE